LGLNLSVYKNSAVDAILEINHTTIDKEQIAENLTELQELIYLDRPAIFLNSPDYISAYYKKLKIDDDQIYNSFSNALANIDQ
jgi:ABC-type transport system substrate-binding protein